MKIIFVCTGNTCRSPMAEYIMREECRKNGLNIEVESRGVDCAKGHNISPNSLLALQEIGIDASKHLSKPFCEKDIDADMIITMTRNHKELLQYYFSGCDKVQTFGEATNLCDVRDPYGFDIEAYRACRNLIEKGVRILAEKLKK